MDDDVTIALDFNGMPRSGEAPLDVGFSIFESFGVIITYNNNDAVSIYPGGGAFLWQAT